MAEKPWEYYTGPHLAQALRNAWDLVSAASNFTDAADVRDYQQYGTEASRALLNRDWQGLGETAPAALAAGASMLIPGIAGIGGMVKRASDLPMDEASRMARAREMGFDVDGPMYHGTVSENIWEFSDNAIGSAHDTGHYGRGHYFADTPGEASYYGPNVGEYVTNAKLLDLSNKTGDYTFLGHFKSFAPKLDAIGALDPDQKKALAAVTSAEKYVDENIEFLRAQGFDGKDGWMARVKNPAPGFTDKISTRVGRRGEFPATKDEAREALKSRFLSEMQFHHPEIYPGLGDEHASLSDYVRTQFGAGELTEAAKRAGYEGIKYGSETVIFDPKKIRSTKAKFDPANKDSADLLASWAAALGIGGLAAGALAPSDAKAKERR